MSLPGFRRRNKCKGFQQRCLDWQLMTTIRIALAQINTTVGDFAGNAAKIIANIEQARKAGADIVSVPELALPGYPPEDLLLKPQFIAANLKALDEIIAASKGIISIVGF